MFEDSYSNSTIRRKQSSESATIHELAEEHFVDRVRPDSVVRGEAMEIFQRGNKEVSTDNSVDPIGTAEFIPSPPQKNSYLRSFVIGSSFFVFVLFFLAVGAFQPKYLNYSYKSYTFIAPVGLGVMNMVSLFISNYFGVSRRLAIFIISLVAPVCVLIFVKQMHFYNYTLKDWFSHIWMMFLLYSFVWNIVVYNLEIYV